MTKPTKPPIVSKLLPNSLRRRLPIEDEIQGAKKSWAYWWFKTLQQNDDYAACLLMGGEGELAELYADFGDVHMPFNNWWVKHGRKTFSETAALPAVGKLATVDDLRKIDFSSDKLILEVPLTMRKQTAMRQIGRLMKKAYEGRVIDVMKQSTMRRKPIKTKLRKKTVELLLEIHRIRQRHPNYSLNEIGKAAGIELDLLARTTDGEEVSEDMERRRMQIAVSRYIKQARHLIENAGKGVFPCIKPLSDDDIALLR